MHRCLLCLPVMLLHTVVGFGPTTARAQESAAADVVFARDIQPLLAKHCFACHGPDKAESGLRLDLAKHAVAALESGAYAIVPGKPHESELLRRISAADEAERMPPEGEPLAKREIALLEAWIKSGAKYETHWAYLPVSEPPLPPVKKTDWVRHPLDRFVLHRLEQAGLAPSPPAERATLLRRLYFDLIGLPPTPDEVDAFLEDKSPGALETVVDRLLASPHFGERWGRHWLDKARYADSDGYEKDNPRPNAWRYRDWVIQAINDDMPYDQFTIEQLAGDLLPDAAPLQKLATAFHRQTLTNTEGGTDQEEFRNEATFDRTETTAAVWLGLTMTCARCHNHKYDQISQREYYQLFAFFNNANESNTEVAKDERAFAEYQKQKAAHDEQVAALEARYLTALEKLQPQIDVWTAEQEALLAKAMPVKIHPLTAVSHAATSGAKLTAQEDGSVLVSGEVPDQDRYTLILELPAAEVTGFRLEALADKSLPAKGPGRAPNGNFVLSQFLVEVSKDQDFAEATRVEFATAEADYSQDRFAPSGALSDAQRSGWAIGAQMGKNHQISFYTKMPLTDEGANYARIVLDQSYGGQHTLGRFRLSAIRGFDPLGALPPPVAEALKQKPEQRTPAQRRTLADHVAAQHAETAKHAQELADLKQKAPPAAMMNVAVMTAAKRTTRVLHRGDFLQPADEVDAGTLATLSAVHPLVSRSEGSPPDRLDLARWLVDARHPLTARVTVNDMWAHLFGRGLVPSVNDFGVRGELPTHPELLDWLAWHFPRDLKWSRKALLKTIVMSSTYQQSSRHRPELNEVDPTNRLLARQNRLRVEAELVRDLHLAVGGLLSGKVGGPSVFPPLPPGVAELSYANNFKWNTSGGEDRYRRGMYTFFKRTAPHPTLISFDCPDSNTTKLLRDSSNTPLQALVTLNNEVFAEAAVAASRRVLSANGENDAKRLTYAWRLCLARQPSDAEIARFEKLLISARDYYQEHPDQAKLAVKSHPAQDTPAAEQAAWVATLRMMMNLDEFIVRE